MADSPRPIDELPQVVLKPRRAQPFFHRHPWVFAGTIERLRGAPGPGEEAALISHDGEFIARGLYNPDSNIRLRLYSWKADGPLDESFWSAQIDRALELRRLLFSPGSPRSRIGSPTSACRLVYSEADGLSGLIVDQYGDWLVVQFTSRALSGRRDLLVRLLKQKLQPSGIWLRTEKGIRESEGLVLEDGLIEGCEPPRPLWIEEGGVRFGVDVVEGQKTGFFIDQRENRAALARYVAGARLLDVFCYGGAFGLAALVNGGAREVWGVDVSEAALVLARANAELNGVSARTRYEKGTAFEALERLRGAGERFDCVVLDPPKMTRRRAGLAQALRGYHSLNQLAVAVLRPGGLLATCSCSGLVSRADFEEMLAAVSLRTGRPIQILEARGQAPDHPTSVHCPETEYLKCYLCRVV